MVVDEAEKSVCLAEIRGFTKLDVKVVPEEDGYPPLEATEGIFRDALFDPEMDISDVWSANTRTDL